MARLLWFGFSLVLGNAGAQSGRWGTNWALDGVTRPPGLAGRVLSVTRWSAACALGPGVHLQHGGEQLVLVHGQAASHLPQSNAYSVGGERTESQKLFRPARPAAVGAHPRERPSEVRRGLILFAVVEVAAPVRPRCAR
jgi:hypothetical protein